MREIKFRAWDPIRYEYYFGYDCFNPVPFGYVALIVEQFTGLKDKNGVEIYEGDIISSDFYEPYEPCVCAIKYKPSLMRFVFDDFEQDAYEYGGLTVIGNIHQNPELLD